MRNHFNIERRASSGSRNRFLELEDIEVRDRKERWLFRKNKLFRLRCEHVHLSNPRRAPVPQSFGFETCA